MVQARWNPDAVVYLARRRAEGKSPAEARRCLKRHLATVVYEPCKTTPRRHSCASTRRLLDIAAPHEDGVLRLAGSVLIEVHDEWQVAERRYLSEGSMAKLYENDNDGVDDKEVGTNTKELLAG